MNYAILASTQHDDYEFYLPITVRFWRKMGFASVVFLYGTQEDWTRPRDKVMLGALYAAGARAYYLGNVNGCSKALAVKLSRWCAAFHHVFRHDDFLVISDADLWPLDAEWFRFYDAARFVFWNSDIHGPDQKMHSACYVGGRAQAWRDAMTYSGTPMTLQTLVYWLHTQHEEGSAVWRNDEQSVGRISWHWGKDGSEHHPADLTKRIDRSDWPTHPKAAGMRDAHLPRPGTDDKVWRAVLPLVEQVIQEYRAAIESYRNEYKAAME